MAIPVTCRCGSHFEARDEHAGRQATCPDCGAKLRVPERQAPRALPAAEPASGFRCADCGRTFQAADVLQDEGDIICRTCLGQAYVQEETGIEVQASFFPLMWLLYFTTPRIEIDGENHALRWWRTEFFPLKPGRHEVRMHVDHLFGPVGRKEVRVRVAANQVRSLNYQYVAFWAPASLTVR